ncbi:MAG: hypothetical protein JXA71_19500 [Chitinispirillaceae bacterium]|nr:hypothetical protein [Chitinispirillaceae bacterium]
MATDQTTETSQKLRILHHLQAHGEITPMDALNLYGCFRLGARIYDLQRDGHLIEHSMSSIGNKRFAVYKLAKCDGNGQLSFL